MGSVCTMTTTPQSPRRAALHDVPALRRACLAASVLRDIDLLPDAAEGVLLTGVPEARVTWSELAAATGGVGPDSALGMQRVVDWLAARRLLADRLLPEILEQVRPLALAQDDPVHPGPGWIRHRVLGGALDLGLGIAGLDPARPLRVRPLPAGVLESCGLSPAQLWPAVLDHLEDMGTMAVLRWRRQPDQPVKPLGDCDALTLLGSRIMRRAVASESQGMATIAAPMRDRCWLDLSRIDPAFTAAAFAATAETDRGFERPLLVTGDEVATAVAGQRSPAFVLLDPAQPDPVDHQRSYGLG